MHAAQRAAGALQGTFAVAVAGPGAGKGPVDADGGHDFQEPGDLTVFVLGEAGG
ncbi:hypothetical protein Acsp03_70010 [Actinomadura sp. NBRC 104412]|nr:hypothetical protein Acsp03_70010 [Actinomadura sp. NBRC 104412]